MRSAAFWQRVDVQMGLAMGAAIAFLLVALMAVLFFVASHEAAEMVDETLETEIAHIAFELQQRGFGEATLEPISRGTAIRLVDAAGTRDLAGTWPAQGRLFSHRTSSMRLAFASAADHLTREVVLPDGRRLEGAASLAEFVEDCREQLAQIALSLVLGLFGAIAVAIFATRRALAPLREATRQLQAIDERRLDARLAVRGSGDDFDRHAIALNRVFARLDESFRRMSAFSADVAHELRTPVNRALNLADVALLTHDAEAGKASQELVAIRESMEDMRRLIERLLLLAKGDVGRLPLQRAQIDLAELGADLAELFRPSCEQNGVDVRVTRGAGDTTAWVDAGLLQQAVANLLDNALRHAPEGSTIRIEIGADAGDVQIAIADAGPGVPEADRERIFDRFFRLDASRSAPGTGLGLAIARMIARLHGGDVTAVGAATGGACFALRVPRKPIETSAAGG